MDTNPGKNHESFISKLTSIDKGDPPLFGDLFDRIIDDDDDDQEDYGNELNLFENMQEDDENNMDLPAFVDDEFENMEEENYVEMVPDDGPEEDPMDYLAPHNAGRMYFFFFPLSPFSFS